VQPEVDAPMRSGNWPPFIGHARALTASAVSRATHTVSLALGLSLWAWLEILVKEILVRV